MKTAELTGAALDWAVPLAMFEPSTDWAQGGPIIERERISVVAMPDGSWQAQGINLRPHFHNPTPLIAAMRCYVASKLGDDIEIPKELTA